MTLSGNPGKAGTVVETPTLLGEKGDGRQQWICAAVSGVVNPLKLTTNCNVWAMGSTVTVAMPVPFVATTGFSLLPLRMVERVVGLAHATDAYSRAIGTNRKRFIVPPQGSVLSRVLTNRHS
jgi:hypothetical protein